jgi:hypothetical protein
MPISSATAELRVRALIRSALEADVTDRNFSLDLVLELALAQFLDLEAVTFSNYDPVITLGQLCAENAILKDQLAAQEFS